MRVMKKQGSSPPLTFVVREWVMTRNFWEFYVIHSCPEETGEVMVAHDFKGVAHDPDKGVIYPEESEVQFCYVMGDENEMGDVWMPEIEPYIRVRTKKLEEVMPPPGYDWVE